MKTKSRFLTAGISGLLTLLLIILLRFVDVAPIGPAGTCVGLSHLNRFVFELCGVHILWYEITDWLGVAAILTAFLFAAAGLVQLVKRRNLCKVDGELLLLGGLYLAVIGLYVFFEHAIVNVRPILMPGAAQPEASFPSSHTMIVCVIMGSAIMLCGRYIKRKVLCRTLQAICALIIGITVIGRLLSGVHWFTDIIGGVLISISLLALFSGALAASASSGKADPGKHVQ